MSDFPVTIYHNPRCGTSRNTLAMIRAAGVEPTVVEYLKTGWTKAQLTDLAAATGAPLRDLLRAKEPLLAELKLAEPGVTDAQLLDAMVEHPILVNRPIVVTPKGTRLCRPSEVVLDLLETPPESFTKEDGEVVTTGR
ncbi:arsenate reductase (glutaredoxin) [Xanthobacter aminoxidans]|uniref:arsenate reductase (glutaredoxin) n=1 Tax=Xanthobacter aminoxidans TaxID=186280 RepID=UPI002022FB89|nr:arsenate reductase (glutaredoxin) [Xanthobacter aminoxidans]MCL8383233.1 arsenate reductase (glutaredoxin) [Xanthobacter aminoxidans]